MLRSSGVLPAARRRGAARAVLAALAADAREEGVEGLYLQVERSNAAAIALYASASFRELYGYHYRGREVPRSEAETAVKRR